MFKKLVPFAAALTFAMMASAAYADQTLRFATWDGDKALEIQKQIAAKFEAAHPGVKVQVEAYGDGYDQKISAAFGAGNPPDVMYMWDFPTYQASLEALDPYIAKGGIDTKDMAPGLLGYAQVHGADGSVKTVGIPSGFTTHVVYYNKEMFDAAGVPYPKEGWSWDDLRATAAKLASKDKKVYGYGVDGNPDLYDFQSYLWSNGATWVSPDGKTTVGHANSDKVKAIFKMFVDMVKSGDAVLFGVGDNQSYRELFISNHLAMVESGNWPKPDFEAANKKFGTVGLPAFPGHPAMSVVNISAVSMAKDSKEKDLAWEFIKYYASPDAVAMRTNDMPILMSVAKTQGLSDGETTAAFYKMLPPADSKNVPAFLLNPNWAKAQDVLLAAVQTIYVDLDGVDATLDEAAAAADKKLGN